MAEGNGEVVNDSEMIEVKEEPMDQSVEHSEDYGKLIDYGLNEKVASKLDEIYKTGKLAHADLDERSLDALKEFPVDGALAVLSQFSAINLDYVRNKSAYLCGVMRTCRQKGKLQGTSSNASVKGPDEDKIKAILERTGYTLDVTTGQRKYGGPPPAWEGMQPGNGCEVYVGKIPKDMFEDELIPLFEKCGKIWDLRLMMDPMTGQNKGYAFITFCDRDGAQAAVKQVNNFEMMGKTLKVEITVPKLRLFVANIPTSKNNEEIFEQFTNLTDGLVEVISYSSPAEMKKNRGFCFLEYESHKAASLAKRQLGTCGRVKVWGCDIIVDWADPQEEPDEETMAKVKVLYVRNLTFEVTEELLKETFEVFGKVERVKLIKDYAFVHFEERDHALAAMEALNGADICGARIEVSLAKPPSDKQKKQEKKAERDRRLLSTDLRKIKESQENLESIKTLASLKEGNASTSQRMSIYHAKVFYASPDIPLFAKVEQLRASKFWVKYCSSVDRCKRIKNVRNKLKELLIKKKDQVCLFKKSRRIANGICRETTTGRFLRHTLELTVHKLNETRVKLYKSKQEEARFHGLLLKHTRPL